MTESVSLLKEQINQLQVEKKELEQQWKQKYAALEAKVAYASKSHTKHNPLMENIGHLLNSRREYVKSLISDGNIAMDDIDKRGNTLLMWASQFGDYDISQLCLSLGADTDLKNQFGFAAIDYTKQSSAYHCEQLLLFSKLNANVSDNVQNIAYEMNKQNGIIENILNELNNIIKDKNERNKFMNVLTTIMCSIIGKKLSFSDDLLNLCWIYNSASDIVAAENRNMDSSRLWTTLIKTCNDIINNGSKKDWYYFKTFILTSNVCNYLL